MTQQEIHDRLHVRPFEPFRLYLSDQSHYDVFHPELAIAGPRSIVIGVTAEPERGLVSRLVTVSIPHVVRIEPLQPQTTQ